MELSRLFFKTHKEAPSDAHILSHQLMERAGYIRRLGKGTYSYTPLMWKVLRKLMELIRKELDRVGCQEVFMPQLQPEEIWKESGRWDRYIAEDLLFTLRDREDNQLCLGPTHEEAVTTLVKNWLTSYKQLPVNLYQITNKFRDEIRPRFGLMRAKEFLMKDGYAFCCDENSMNAEYEKMRQAYIRIFDRLELEYAIVAADGGAIGKGSSEEFQVLAHTGEDNLLVCSSHSSNVEALQVHTQPVNFKKGNYESAIVKTPDAVDIKTLCKQLSCQEHEILKTIIYKLSFAEEESFIAVCIRGDRQVNELKLLNLKNAIDIELASEEELMRIVGVRPGFVGPKDLPIEVLADYTCENMENFVVAVNKNDLHMINANWQKEVPLPPLADLLLAQEGDLHIDSKEVYKAFKGIEVGHIFNLGDKYSTTMHANFQDEQGHNRPLLMGCYGMGIGRLAAACIEQKSDERGMIWPISIAPYHIFVTAVNVAQEAQFQAAKNLYKDLIDQGYELLFDDRKERIGFKLKDADLIGIPYKIIVGKKWLEEELFELEERNGNKHLFKYDELVCFFQKSLKPILL